MTRVRIFFRLENYVRKIGRWISQGYSDRIFSTIRSRFFELEIGCRSSRAAHPVYLWPTERWRGSRPGSRDAFT